MSDQIGLPGFEQAQPASTTRSVPGNQNTLFLAILPRPDDAVRLARSGAGLRAELGLTGKPLEPERLHVTLFALGGYPAEPPPEIVEAAKRAAAATARGALDIVFDRAMSFSRRPGSKPFVLCSSDGAPSLKAFRQRLGAALASEGLDVPRTFTPHMTLAYDRRSVDERTIEPLRWAGSELALVYSYVGQHLHERLGRSPLSV